MNIKNKLNILICSPFLIIIWIYQSFISPLIPTSCIYWPSCSEYSKQAFKKHGLLGGMYLSITRLLRCHPFHKGGIDKVPESIQLFTVKKNG